MNNREVEKLINGIKAMAEMNYVFFQAHIDRGFTRAEALELTKAQVTALTIRPKDKTGGDAE